MNINEFHLPRFEELPKVPLYKEQVIIYLQEILKGININEQSKLLTPTMINSYVKQRVVSPPKDKKYNEKHLAYLIVVCILKQVFSIQDICKLINIQIDTYPIDVAYDYFCTEVENALQAVFITRDFSYSDSVGSESKESQMVRSTIRAFVHKLYIEIQLKEYTV